MTFRISASKLNAYYSCPAQFDFGRRLEPLTKDVFLQDGNDAHLLMAGGKPETLSPRARSFYEQLTSLYHSCGYMPLWEAKGKPVVELKQELALTPNIQLVRIIDAFAMDKSGEAVLIDYKTAVWPWRTIGDAKGNPVAQAMGFQAAAYLIPPVEPAPFKWPTRIDFLVASERGGSDVHTYRYNQKDVDNLIEACEVIAAAKTYPKHKGSGCYYCPMNQCCYETPNWKKAYRTKKGKTNGKKIV